VQAHARNVGVALGTLLASGATLLCCVLPAMLVSIGAGATLVALVSALPQLVWLSEHKGYVFLVAGLLLLAGGAMIWRSRRLPCPVVPSKAQSCELLRRTGAGIYGLALLAYAVGAGFAYVLPALDS
jgi:hypothetical protein